eukprot:4443627-Prymnesium_polylepis.1
MVRAAASRWAEQKRGRASEQRPAARADKGRGGVGGPSRAKWRRGAVLPSFSLLIAPTTTHPPSLLPRRLAPLLTRLRPPAPHRAPIRTEAKADELLLPVLKAFDATGTQARLDSYFSFEYRFARFQSSRLADA